MSRSDLPAPPADPCCSSSLATCSCPPGRTPAPFDYVIGVSMANLTEPWRINMRDEIMAEAGRHRDLRIVFTDAADSNSRQIQDVHTLLDSGIDLLIISPNESEALSPVITEAYQRIPVILLDRSVIGFDYTLFIGPDNRLIGKQAGQYVSGAARARGREDRRDPGAVRLPAGAGPEHRLPGGHRRSSATSPSWTRSSADWLRDKAEDELTAWLTEERPRGRHLRPERRHGRRGAPGRREAGDRRDHGWSASTGCPARAAASRWSSSGALAATFTCPTGGKEAVIYALDILHHEEGIPKKMILRTSLVTRQDHRERRPGRLRRRRGCPAPITASCWASPRSARRATGAWRTRSRSRPRPGRRGSTWSSWTPSSSRKSSSRRSAPSSPGKVDIIAFSPIVESGWEPVLREAKAAGIPVFITDRAVDVKDESLWVTLHGLGLRGGRPARGALADRLPEDGQAGEHRGAAGHDRLGAGHRPQDRLRGGAEGPPQLPDHRLARAGTSSAASARRSCSRSSRSCARRGPQDGRPVRAQRRHGHRRHRGHGGRGDASRARTWSSCRWTGSATPSRR